MILIDLFGSGFSDAPQDFNYSVESHAEVVALLVSRVCNTPVDLFGHSMGGSIAIVAAGLLGPLVQRLALSEPNLDPGGGTFSRRIAAMTESEYVSQGHTEIIADARMAGHLVWANSLAISSASGTHRGATSLVDGCFPSWRQLLHGLMMPKTVIFGERSLPDDDTVRLANESCAIAVIADAGHSMATENPGGFAAALRNAFP